MYGQIRWPLRIQPPHNTNRPKLLLVLNSIISARCTAGSTTHWTSLGRLSRWRAQRRSLSENTVSFLRGWRGGAAGRRDGGRPVFAVSQAYPPRQTRLREPCNRTRRLCRLPFVPRCTSTMRSTQQQHSAAAAAAAAATPATPTSWREETRHCA